MAVNLPALTRLPYRAIEAGGRAATVVIGAFTNEQFDAVNTFRCALGPHAIERREIVFIGRHPYTRRARDGYAIDVIWDQIAAALSPASAVIAGPAMTALALSGALAG